MTPTVLITWILTILAAITVSISVPLYKDTKSPGFVVDVGRDGTYSIQVNGKTWLPSADTYFYADGAKYSSADGSLKLVKTATSSGTNKLGNWENTDLTYQAGRNEITASVKSFASANAVIFSQKYNNSTYGTTSGNTSSVSSAFPSFKVTGEPNHLGFLTYGGSFLGASYVMGRWTENTAYVRDGVGGGPLVLFDHDGNVIIISSFSEFMAASMFHNEGSISWGIMGGVNEIPAMYESSFIVFYGDKGINEGMREWGELMRFWYGRDLSYRDSDLTINYLGFCTDNGAYYFKNTDPNKTYEDIILDVKAYSDQMNIPYRYVQYDNWWYYKGWYGGSMTWEARPEIFPHGLEYIYNKTGWPVLAQNKWWSTNTTYAKQNGGKYDFIIEYDSQKAIPNDTTFWPDFLQRARKWGLTTYEQDWMDKEFSSLNATLRSINMGRDWLKQMGEGAAKNDLRIQYCMPNPRHGLQALEIPVVTQSRVSSDYQPGSTHNWRIGQISMFADALGLAPFKDNFWTTNYQPGNVYHANATNPALECLIATLSTGPVGPSDMVGGTDVDLLMRCCNADGLILKPSRPARSIDSNILQRAFQDGSGPDEEVWSTTSEIDSYTFGTIVAPEQTQPYQLTPADAGLGSDIPHTVIFKHLWPVPTAMANFSQNAPLTISGCSTDDPCLWHTAPVFNLGSTPVYIYGEVEKWVPMSPKRVTSIEVSDDIYVTLVGAVGEAVQFAFATHLDAITTISCYLGLSGSAILGLVSKTCRSL